MSRAFGFNIRVCIPCDFSQKNCAGACACTVDNIDIRDHARAGECPKDYFPDPSTLPPPRPSAPCSDASIPRAQWPRRVKLLARLAIPEDRGAGDTLARITAATGVDIAAKAWSMFVADCGCSDKRAAMNVKYPYENSLASP